METYFASPERVTDAELAFEIDFVSKNPVMSGMLHSINGLLAVLDEHRQVVAINDTFLQMLGIDDPSQILGLRPGEVLSQSQSANYEPQWQPLTAEQIVDELRAFFANHPVARKRDILFSDKNTGLQFKSDIFLVLRVLCNMIINALEATPENGKVSFTTSEADGTVFRFACPT